VDTEVRSIALMTSPKHLQRYLDEFVFGFDRRRQEAGLFSPVLTSGLAGERDRGEHRHQGDRDH
jgi:hypothetical protein